MGTRAVVRTTARFLYFVIATSLCAAPSSTSNYGVTDEVVAAAKEHGIETRDGIVYVYGTATSVSKSSTSSEAVLQKAEFDAKQRLVENCFLRLAHEEVRIPAPLRNRLARVLARNSHSSLEMKGFCIAKSGILDGEGWVVLAGPEAGLIFGGSTNISTLAVSIISSVDSRLTPRDADVFLESFCRFNLDGLQRYWLSCQQASLRAQLQGRPVDGCIRKWVQNGTQLDELKKESELGVEELKQDMQVLPYSSRLIAALVSRYTREHMDECAKAFRAIPWQCQGTGDEALKSTAPSAFTDAIRAGENTNGIVRVIVGFNGELPTCDEPKRPLYADALKTFEIGSMDDAAKAAVAAMQESINADTLNLYGAILRRLGHAELGSVLCRQAHICRPSHAYALVNEALCMEALGRQDEARKLADRALRTITLDTWGKSQVNRLLQGDR